QEAPLTHPGSPRDQRSERTHPRNPPCRHDRQKPPTVQERTRPLEVVTVEYLPTTASDDFCARVAPDVVTHLISEHRHDQRGPAHQPRLHFCFVRRQHHTRTEQQRVTGQEQAHDERALTENEAEYDDPHQHRTSGLEPTRVDTVRRCCVHASHTLSLSSMDTSSSVARLSPAVATDFSHLGQRFTTYSLNVQLDVDRRADSSDTSPDKRIVADSEVTAVQLCLGVERRPLTAPQILFVPTVAQIEFDRAAATVQRELTGQHPTVAVLPAEHRADELDQRVCLDVQEIGGAKMIVAHPAPAAHRTRLDLGANRRILHRRAHFDPATHLPATGPDTGYPEMPRRGDNR